MWTLGGLLLKRSQAVLALDVRRGTTLGRPLGDRQLQLLGRAACTRTGRTGSNHTSCSSRTLLTRSAITLAPRREASDKRIRYSPLSGKGNPFFSLCFFSLVVRLVIDVKRCERMPSNYFVCFMVDRNTELPLVRSLLTSKGCSNIPYPFVRHGTQSRVPASIPRLLTAST